MSELPVTVVAHAPLCNASRPARGQEATLIRNRSDEMTAAVPTSWIQEAHELTHAAGAVMVTRDDLEWWLNRITELDWVFAVTYAEGAPHEYVTADRTPGFSREDSVRAARIIRTFGQPAKFFRTTRIYLEDGRGWKYWDMANDDVTVSGIINRGRVEHVYGVQNAPRTSSGIASPYDDVATDWDRSFGATADEREAIVDMIESLGDFRKKRVLDIGCGTGLALDLGITVPARYVGIDPSQAMLNRLVVKYPHIAGLHPMTFEQALEQRVLGRTKFDLVLALGGVGSYLTEAELTRLAEHSVGPILLSAYGPREAPATRDLDTNDIDSAHKRLILLAASHGGKIRASGRFSFAVFDAWTSPHRPLRA